MRLGLPGILLLVIGLLFVVPSAVGFYTDWLWFRELGYEGVFLRSLNAQFAVFGATFFAVFVFLYFNIRLAARAMHAAAHRPRHGRAWPDDRLRSPPPRQTGLVALARRRPRARSLRRDELAGVAELFNAVPFGERGSDLRP